MPTPEQRIKQAAAHLSGHLPLGLNVTELAKGVLEAADREHSTWPTDESVDAYRSAFKLPKHFAATPQFEESRDALRAAMTVDPVLQTAIKVGQGKASLYELREALLAAGLIT